MMPMMSKKRVKLSNQIRQAIDVSGFSRYHICKAIDLPQSTMSRFMSGELGLSMAYADALADFLDLNITSGSKQKSRSVPKGR